MVLPNNTPGYTVAEAMLALAPLLPLDLFPNGEMAGLLKATQLDLDAKGLFSAKRRNLDTCIG